MEERRFNIQKVGYKMKDKDIEALDELTFYATEDLDSFLKAPRKAQEIFFAGVSINDAPPWVNKNIPVPTIEPDLTPIETIFDIAYKVYREFGDKKYHYLEAQHEIFTEKGKHYIADFYNKDANLIIECDGHDFHQKTKEQVAHDNERELDLKMEGYNILRFSGSQIYNNPFKCVSDTYTYIEKILRG